MNDYEPLRKALRDIATGTPAEHRHGNAYHTCSQCAAYIDLAREALGMPAFAAEHEEHAAHGADSDAEGRILDGLAHIAPE
jgi:hypothetical protein